MADSGNDDVAAPVGKLPTHVRGLDEVLRGGIPRMRTTLINGGTGTGKTVLALEIAYRNALSDNPSVFLSLEETADAIRANAATLGWELPPLESAGKLRILDPRMDPAAVRTAGFSLGGLRAIIQGVAQQMSAACVVMDAIDAATTVFRNEEQEQDEIVRLLRWFSENRTTVILTAKRFAAASANELMDFLSDCVIDLDQRVLGQVTTRRLRVVKYRGSGYASNENPFFISDTGIKLMAVTGSELPKATFGPPMSTGNASLDGILGRGVRRGSSVLIAGETGTGKTTLACTIARAVAEAGERALYISFEESAGALVDSMAATGVSLEGAIDSGNFVLLTAMPEAMGTEEQLFRIVGLLDEHDPSLLVLDAITATLRMGSEQAAFDLLVRVLTETKKRGATCVYISQTTRGGLDGLVPYRGVSSLIDTILILRYVTVHSTLKREILVLKNRGASHSRRYHRFEIGERGIEIEIDADQGAPS